MQSIQQGCGDEYIVSSLWAVRVQQRRQGTAQVPIAGEDRKEGLHRIERKMRWQSRLVLQPNTRSAFFRLRSDSTALDWDCVTLYGGTIYWSEAKRQEVLNCHSSFPGQQAAMAQTTPVG